ncbi:stage III sporulation protein AA [Hazenella sp. IB182357]|uniref:Stage III sporulation protein AA n=1 Tax=Polycladospora coralii TaxID=2771432 RepID=A0A926NH46_9BACL|nr:stage III sporulation protein AA [Polycladospora coralii]MBD1373233.1 stage III sporulation protein AA [Polycladospora coralii]
MSLKEIYQVLPPILREQIQSLPRTIQESLEEIRVRQSRPLEVITSEQNWFVNANCQLSAQPQNPIIPTKEDCSQMVNLISRHSLYALEEELRMGFITVEGGHRIGIVGKVTIEGGKVKIIRDLTGFNIRIAKQIKGVGEGLIPFIFTSATIHNTLIVSPPQCGKTTLLRDLTRIASTGSDVHRGVKVGLVDERSEIAGSIHGVPQLDIGVRTDVLDACPKAEGMMMMIRSMSPEVLVFDEIGRVEDREAIQEAIFAGVKIFTTVHGQSIEEIQKRPLLAQLLADKAFTRIIILNRGKGPGTIVAIYDESLRSIRLNGAVGMTLL